LWYFLGFFAWVDGAVAASDGFGYSGSLIAVAETWTPENLNAFLENPSAYAPGTAMNFRGIRKIEDRANRHSLGE